MKNVLKLIEIIALVAVIGFSMATCGDGGGGGNSPKSIKITGITLTDAEINGEACLFIYTKPQFGHGPDAGLVAREDNLLKVTNGELLVDLYVCDDGYDASNVRWTGSGEYYVYLGFANLIGWPDGGGGGDVLRYWWAKNGNVAKYDIKDALTTIPFSQFKK